MVWSAGRPKFPRLHQKSSRRGNYHNCVISNVNEDHTRLLPRYLSPEAPPTWPISCYAYAVAYGEKAGRSVHLGRLPKDIQACDRPTAQARGKIAETPSTRGGNHGRKRLSSRFTTCF